MEAAGVVILLVVVTESSDDDGTLENAPGMVAGSRPPCRSARYSCSSWSLERNEMVAEVLEFAELVASGNLLVGWKRGIGLVRKACNWCSICSLDMGPDIVPEDEDEAPGLSVLSPWGILLLR